MTPPLLSIDVAPYRLSGVVYSAQLNHRPQWLALGEAAHQPPYKAPAQAPVLAVKPRNTLVASGAHVAVPAEGGALAVGATLAVLIGRTACRVPLAQALSVVAGYTVVADLSVPHSSHYRPAVRLKARDGSCVLGTRVVPAAQVAAPDALVVQVEVNGAVVHTTDTADRLRGVAQLIADVTEFMTLQPGDLLLLGESAGAPLAVAGDEVHVAIAGVDALTLTLVRDTAATTPTGSPA
jgi:5-oxopent-3-ene-1,2,5-tricarboxylate decarboxylase/2-hydroxyhepta-2,4-diene-1,7-dioate isomerase